MACKGNEDGLARNIEAILKQSYPEYRIIIVTDTVEDPAYSVAKSILDRNIEANAELCISEGHFDASGKIAALLTALERDGWASDVYAFLDSDAFVSPRWLADLVDPLADDSVGASTGFRWYFPSPGGFWSHVQSAWNSSGTNLLFNQRYNFPWGGAMAIRTETLKRINIQNVWKNAVSDDMTLNTALRRYGYKVTFLPQCTVASYDGATMRSFLRWATRQTVITRVLNRRLWNYALVAYGFFDYVVILAVVSLVAGVMLSAAWFLPVALLLAPSVLGVWRSSKRMGTFRRAMPEFAREFDRNRLVDSIASLIVPWIMTYCIIRSARITQIEWRGRRYKLTG
jgi:cellulose synthase/poly-beta-1,6-N-acetylglucosamine synthase-like glycosyltransferase